jgi:hypothetical protein
VDAKSKQDQQMMIVDRTNQVVSPQLDAHCVRRKQLISLIKGL